MNRATKYSAVGFAGMIGEDEVKEATWQRYNYKPVESSPEALERCEAAWKILIKYNKFGITRRQLYLQLNKIGCRAYNDFDMLLERHGYLLWIDGDNRLHPYMHPDGTIIEWEQPAELF